MVSNLLRMVGNIVLAFSKFTLCAWKLSKMWCVHGAQFYIKLHAVKCGSENS